MDMQAKQHGQGGTTGPASWPGKAWRIAILLAWLTLITPAHASVAQDVPQAGDDNQAWVSAAMMLPPDVELAVRGMELGPQVPELERVQRLLDFMLADDGLALRYRDSPTHNAAESLRLREVNCLSFTLAFVALARVAGLNAFAQVSDDAVSMRVVNATLFRTAHMNAGVRIGSRSYTVDVGWGFVIPGRAPHPVTDAEAAALLHSNRAIEALLSGDTEAAAAGLRRALALDRDNPAIWSNTGLVHWRQGQAKEAEAAYLRALRLKPDHIGALGNLVGLYEALAAQTQARVYRQRLARAQDRDPFTQFIRAESLLQAGDVASAIPLYRRALKLLPGEPKFLRALAEAHRRKGDAASARRADARADALEAARQVRQGVIGGTRP